MIVKKYIKIDAKAEFIVRTLNKAGYNAYLVGGCIRDRLLGRPVHDWDISTSAEPKAVYDIFGELGLTVIGTGIAYGTVSILISDLDIANISGNSNEFNSSELFIYEVTTFRKESGARKMEYVEFTDKLELDLMRRDFTVNALAYHPDKGIIDINNGIQDLEAGILRCIKDPEKRFAEDPLRIMRAVRFQAQLGFKMDDTLKIWVDKLAEDVNTTSVERIQSELVKTICGDYAYDALMQSSNVIKEIIPELGACIGFDQNNPNHIYDVYTHSIKVINNLVNLGNRDTNLMVAALMHDIAKPVTVSVGDDGYYHFKNHATIGALMAEKIMKRLNFTNSSITEVSNIIKYHDLMCETKSGVKRILNKVGTSTFSKILELRHADILAQSLDGIGDKIKTNQKIAAWFNDIQEGNEAFKVTDLEISGKDLIALGFEPGIQFKTILGRLLELVSDDKISNTKEQLVDYVVKHFKTRSQK